MKSMNKKGSSKLSLAVQYACADTALPSRPRLRRWVNCALEPATRSAQIVLRFTGTAESRRLNRQFRGKDSPTNVLSFPYAPQPDLAGDLLLCVPVVRAEARAQGKEGEAHFAHLVVHGMLHLQGYDHENGNDAARMEGRERDILGKLGYPDPY